MPSQLLVALLARQSSCTKSGCWAWSVLGLLGLLGNQSCAMLCHQSVPFPDAAIVCCKLYTSRISRTYSKIISNIIKSHIRRNTDTHTHTFREPRLEVLRQVCGRCHEESLMATEETSRQGLVQKQRINSLALVQKASMMTSSHWSNGK